MPELFKRSDDKKIACAKISSTGVSAEVLLSVLKQDDDGNENDTTQALMTKTMAVHVRYKSLLILHLELDAGIVPI